MSTAKRLKANELVIMLSGLLNFDVTLMARVANVPKRNLFSWLFAGKKDNLRLQSIASLLTLLGLKIENGIRLDEKRVHFWQVKDGLFSDGKSAYSTLSKLSKLMPGCMITKVVPAKKKLFTWTDYFLVSGSNVRVVVIVNRSIFKRSKISPEVIKGACWRDDNDHHTITANARLWANMVERDLTTYEFDRIFGQVEETVSWTDLSLMAREFGITPQHMSEWIMERFGEAPKPESEDEEQDGLDIGGGRLLELVHLKAA